MPRGEGWAKKPTPWGKPRDMLTWPLLVWMVEASKEFKLCQKMIAGGIGPRLLKRTCRVSLHGLTVDEM